jgi:hypothetical protein
MVDRFFSGGFCCIARFYVLFETRDLRLLLLLLLFCTHLLLPSARII